MEEILHKETFYLIHPKRSEQLVNRSFHSFGFPEN